MKNNNDKPESMIIQIELSDEQLDKIACRAVDRIKQEEVSRAPEKVYSVNEVAERISSVTVDTIRRHCRNGVLKASKSGKSFLITEENLNQYLLKNE